MTRTITIILSFVIICSCGSEQGIDNAEKRNENWCWFVDEITQTGEWIYIGGKDSQLSGDYTLFFSNGVIRQTGTLKNGVRADTIKEYDISGNLLGKIYKDETGEPKLISDDGPYVKYFPTCEKEVEGTIKNNKLFGLRTIDLKNGKIEYKVMQFNDSVYTRIDYSNDIMIDSFTRVNDKTEGIKKHWYPDGQLHSKLNKKNDELDGEGWYYYENGQLKAHVIYDKGVKTYYKSYNDRGELIKEYKL